MAQWLDSTGVVCVVEGLLLKTAPQDMVARRFDGSGWHKTQRVLAVIGKLFSLACLVLTIFTPLRIGSSVLFLGVVLHILGLVGLVIAIPDFKNTPRDQPVTGGLYRISRDPQIVMLSILFLRMCLAIGSWLEVFMLMMSRLLEHFGILAEEEACLARYGESYRAYMRRVARYSVFS